jgi:hypothetical protein
MRFASLGSGSQGNALIVDAGETKADGRLRLFDPGGDGPIGPTGH